MEEFLLHHIHDEASPSPDVEGGLEEDIFSDVLQELTLGFCFEIHRSCKMGQLFLDETDEPSLKFYEIVNEPGRDVFGKPPLKKQIDCICPNCNRNLSASRFAPHLEKCMGMGRNSSRLASKRIANSGMGKMDSDNEDDDRDLDWSFAFDKKAPKKSRKDKVNSNSPRRSKPKCATKIGDFPCVSHVSSLPSEPVVGSVTSYPSKGLSSTSYEGLSLEERKRLLMSTCGVISEHTRKMCTKSLRCPQHTDEQRRIVRRYLLRIDPEGRLRMRPDGSFESDDIHVDIDGYEDGDGQALRETLNRIQQWEGNTSSANPSPADSTSTTNSQEKRRKKGGIKLTQRKKSKVKASALNVMSVPAQPSFLADTEFHILD
ncbi:ataxin-7-like protein 3 [Acanthaster planci]|uniref:SAGA-associated factor 11 homolog n=1 Tax=Acanthaster planci TaxID=133434 RepID=A0A8B7ZMM3_ACAPL|nr:ataxin-7-like protein 3 [Acanthaster planci]